MCLPAAAVAVGSLVVGAAGAGVSAYGAAKSASAQKANAQAEALFRAEQAKISEGNAQQVEAFGALNSSLVLATAGLNNALAQTVTDTNVALINATSDFNIGVIKATTDFNVSSAEGAARLIEAQGRAAETIHSMNADYLEIQADQVLEQGAQAERQSRSAYAQIKGQQRARLAANGVALDEGSALRIQSDTDYASDVDADVIKTNAIQGAFGYRAQAINERTQGAFASLDAQAAAGQKRGEAAWAKITGMVSEMQTKFDAASRTLDAKMTTSVQILQTTTNAKIEALNIKNDAKAQALAYRQQGMGFQAASTSASRTAKSISPALLAGTSLLGSAYQLGTQYTGFKQSGVI